MPSTPTTDRQLRHLQSDLVQSDSDSSPLPMHRPARKKLRRSTRNQRNDAETAMSERDVVDCTRNNETVFERNSANMVERVVEPIDTSATQCGVDS